MQGYELLKGLAGVATHEHIERVPIIENTQEYASLAEHFVTCFASNPDAHGVLLSRHGLYTWGESVAEARRHLEALEFLFEVEGRRLFGQHVRESGRALKFETCMQFLQRPNSEENVMAVLRFPRRESHNR